MKKAKLVKARPRGAPKKEDKEKILPNGLRKDQWQWLQDEAHIKDTSAAYEQRRAVDWYITAIETKRGTVEASKEFDKTFIEGGDVTKK